MKLKLSILIVFLAAIIAFCGCKASSAAPNIVNPGFDDGTGGWEFKAYYDDGSKAEPVEIDGRSAAHIIAANDNDVRLMQDIDVAPGSVYRITCFVKTSGVEGGAGANIGVYGVPVTSEQAFGDSDWQRIELLGKTASGQKKLTLTVGVGGHGALSKGEAWFDEVDIEMVSDDTEGAVLIGSQTASKPTDDDPAPSKFPTGQILFAWVVASAIFGAIWLWHYTSARKPFKASDKKEAAAVIIILFAALAVRIALSLIFYGHKTDINCFTHWGRRVIEVGPAHFYDNWCDYPPGYMLILGFMSWIDKLIGANSADLTALLVKVPCIIADLACAYITYRIAQKTMSRTPAIALLALVAFTPVMAYVSSAWGQIDQALTLALIIPILLLYNDKPVLAGIVYGIGIVMKPQALMCGPLFAAAYALYTFRGSAYDTPFSKSSPDSGAKLVKRLIKTVIAVIVAFAVIILISAPFRGEQGTFWLVEKYYGTATSYDYATVNAYNFWALIGANWKKVDTPFAGLTYGKWGTIFMAVSVIAGIALYLYSVLKHKSSKGALPLTMAFMLAGIFTFGHYMHERYIFPALMLLMLAYLFYNDRRVLIVYVLYATTMLLNCIAAFYYSKLFAYGLYWDERLIFWCSLVNVVLFAYFAMITLDLVFRNKPKKGFNG